MAKRSAVRWVVDWASIGNWGGGLRRGACAAGADLRATYSGLEPFPNGSGNTRLEPRNSTKLSTPECGVGHRGGVGGALPSRDAKLARLESRTRPATWLRPRPARAARMRSARGLRHFIRELGAPAISRGTASRSPPPFCGGVSLSASLGYRGDDLRPRLGPGSCCPSPPAGRTLPRARPGTTPARGRAAAAPPGLYGYRPPAARARGAGAARALTTESGRSLTQAKRRGSRRNGVS